MSNLLAKLTIASLLILVCVSKTRSFNDYKISKAERTVLLNSGYPAQTAKVQYQCIVDSCPSYIYYSIPAEYNKKVNKISFGKDKQSKDTYKHTVENYQHNGSNYALYTVELGQQHSKNNNFVVVAQIIYLNRYVNFPASISLTQDQKFQYEDVKSFVAPYQVKEATVNYKFTKLIQYDQDGQKKGLSTVQFKHSDLQPFSSSLKHVVHGTNNQPQVQFSQVERIIEVSHWGNIAITQFYKIKNIGPGLKGEFSRVQFSSRNSFQAKNAFMGLQTTLPYQIWGLYYRDEVGNISTSKAYRDQHADIVKFALVPRFALLGGWKANWEIGYNLNTKGFLAHKQNSFQLHSVPLSYALSKILAQKYTIRVILPEGSQNVQLLMQNQKINANAIQKDLSFGYLDFSGRPTFTVQDFTGDLKNKELQVKYTYDLSKILYKPLGVFGAIFSALLLLIIIKRLNLSAFIDQQRHAKRN